MTPLIQNAKTSTSNSESISPPGYSESKTGDEGHDRSESLAHREIDPETMIRAPRFVRRNLFVILTLSWIACCWILTVTLSARSETWVKAEHKRRGHQKILNSEAALNYSIAHSPAGNVDAHMPPDFEEMLLIDDLDRNFVPDTNGKSKHNGRLVVVGDVHGMKDELVKLLDKVEFNKKKDHLIFAGDMISKGPDSAGVVQLAMELGASAVRGNHEDRLILTWQSMQGKNGELVHHRLAPETVAQDEKGREIELSKSEFFTHSGEYKDRILLREFNDKQLKWLKKLPVILRVGDIEGMGEVVVVHAGIAPGVTLKRQDPYFVMNMRTIDPKTLLPSDRREGTAWTKAWNMFQKKLPKDQRTTVIYGHDSKRGMVLEEYSKGIDTSCLKGGQLTAFILEGGHNEVKTSVVQLGCPNRASAESSTKTST